MSCMPVLHARKRCPEEVPGRGARKRCPEEITAISCAQYVYPGGLVQIVYEEEGYRVLFETDNGIELEYDMMGTQG